MNNKTKITINTINLKYKRVYKENDMYILQTTINPLNQR